MIYLIGDSHTIMYRGIDPHEIKPVHFGACTAYSLMTEHSITNSFKNIKKYLLENNIDLSDVLIFGFGEIDCRVLIYYKHKKYDIDLKDMIDIVVYRYLSAIYYLKEKWFGVKVAVHGPIPAVKQRNEYKLEFYADEFTRASINDYFNIKLRYICNKNNIPYFNTYDFLYLKGKDGIIPIESLLPDLVHINSDKVPIKDDFKQWLRECKFLKD